MIEKGVENLRDLKTDMAKAIFTMKEAVKKVPYNLIYIYVILVLACPANTKILCSHNTSKRFEEMRERQQRRERHVCTHVYVYMYMYTWLY